MEELELKLDAMDSKKLETALVVQEGTQISEEKVESSLSYDELSDTEKAAIDSFLSKIDVTNTAQILQFGASAQNNISKFSDSVLTEVKTKDVGKVGDLLSDLVSELKSFQGE